MDRRSFLTLLGTSGAMALAASYAVAIERTALQINRYRIPVAGLPPAFHGFTLAHLTDVHLGLLVSDRFVEGVVHQTNQLGADAIVCTGDFVRSRNTIKEIDRVWPLLAKLQAPAGVFSVLGNHDHWADTERSLYWMERSGQGVRHTARSIVRGRDRLWIGGAGDYMEDTLAIDSAFAAVDRRECKILLSHNPDSIDTEFTTDVSLVIAGHTHGGQVIVPFFGPPVLPVHNRIYTSGLIRNAKVPVFISRGIGWSIYPVRFNCFPEIALLELVPAAKRA